MRRLILMLVCILSISVLRVTADSQYRVWIDDDCENVLTYPGQTTLHADIDVSALTSRWHTLYMMYSDAEGRVIGPYTSMFYIAPVVKTGTSGSLHAVLNIDGVTAEERDVPFRDGVLYFDDLDVGSLTVGLHDISMYIYHESGEIFDSVSSIFWRTAADCDLEQMTCYYSIDGAEMQQAQPTSVGSNAYHLELDVAAITPGLHKVTTQLVSPAGIVKEVQTDMFICQPLGGNGIKRYRYWLNDDNASEQIVEVDDNPHNFALATLLPVQSVPLRTALFHFEVDNTGTPRIYASNKFNFEVYAADGRTDKQSSVYTDYSQSRVVTDITELQGSQTVTLDKPAEDEIAWYKMSLLTGDSINIMANASCTLQIFNGAGDELYNATGVTSTKLGGIHANTDGDYYLALHDVNGKASTLKLTYNHIDKYVVLSSTPKNIGAADAVAHISLVGNGYDKLKSVRLINGSESIYGTNIKSNDMAHVSFAVQTSTGMTYGDYDMELTFNDGTKNTTLTVPKAVKIEAPKYGTPKISIKSRRSAATPYPVTLVVENPGNVEYQMVPFVVAFEDPENLETVQLVNFDVFTPDLDSEASAYTYTDTYLGQESRDATFIAGLIPALRAPQEYTIGFVAGAHDLFNMSAWTYRPWSLEADIEMIKNNEHQNGPCVFYPWDMVSGIAKDALEDIDWRNFADDFAPQTKAVKNASMKYNGKHKEYVVEVQPVNHMLSVYETIGGLLASRGLTSGQINEINQEFMDYIMTGCDDRYEATINNYRSGDPNDMLGYLSPTNTHDIGKDIVDLSYTIEFENDPAIATADARHITITNVIDPNVFDLSTFAPVSIKIGNLTVPFDGSQNFSVTADMRPSFEAIAQVSLAFDINTGLATWDLISLDPKTLDPSEEVGILPVNDDAGIGLGEIQYDITRRADIAHGTVISNQATITFDGEASINTPVWDNTIDAELPTSTLRQVSVVEDKLVFDIDASDQGSGLWKYQIYMKPSDTESWQMVGDCTTDATELTKPDGLCNGIQFCILAVDKAGNVEDKSVAAEAILSIYQAGDANNDGKVDYQDVTLIVKYYTSHIANIYLDAADYNSDGIVDLQDVSSIVKGFTSTPQKTAIRKIRIK